MARLCERPGCSQAAAVSYGIDADHLTVWLGAFDGPVGYRAGVLCRRHADAMVVPLGWMLDDRREAIPRLFPGGVDKPLGQRAKRRRSLSPVDDVGGAALDIPLPLDPDPILVVVAAHDAQGMPEVEVAAMAPVEAPWEPSFDSTTDHAGLGQARSPLLSRAFGRRHHREATD